MHATVTVPGSKSQTNRALVLAALAAAQGQGTSTISGALRSRDTDLMIGALRTLGLRVDGDGTELTVSGRIAPGPDGAGRLRPGRHGAAVRPAAGGAGASRRSSSTATSRPGRGPSRRCWTRCAGSASDIDGAGLPFRVLGTGSVTGGTVDIDASASSQFVSGLLLCAASFAEGLTVQHTGASLPSAPHIAMTVAMLRQAGVDVDDSDPNRWQVRAGAGRGAALGGRAGPDERRSVPGGGGGHRRRGAHHRLAGRQRATRRRHPDRVGQAECRCHAYDSYLEVRGSGDYGGFDVDLRAVGELTPSVAALAALATPGSVSRLTGIAHLRGHETDRLAALSTEINRLGGDCERDATTAW